MRGVLFRVVSRGITSTAHESAGVGLPADRSPRRSSGEGETSSKTVRPPSLWDIERSWAIVSSTSAKGSRPSSTARVKRVQPLHAVQLLRVTDSRGSQRPAQHTDRVVVDLQRHRERVSVLSAMRERKPGRILEPRRRTVHHFRDERQRLQRPRTELLQQQERGEVAQLAFVRERQHRAEPFRVDVRRPDIVMRRHLEPPHLGDRLRRDPRGQSSAARPAPGRRGDRPGCGSSPASAPTIAVCGSAVKSRTAGECQ